MPVTRSTLAVAITLLLSACGAKPPGCADAETFAVAKKMVIDGTTEATYVGDPARADPNGRIKKFIDGLKIEIIDVVNDGYNADANKQQCKGTLKITTINGDVFQRSVEYSTQPTEDRKGNFVLEIKNFQPFIGSTRQSALHYYIYGS